MYIYNFRPNKIDVSHEPTIKERLTEKEIQTIQSNYVRA